MLDTTYHARRRARRKAEHVHDFHPYEVKIEGRAEPFRMQMDCDCGRCPRGVCDGSNEPERAD